MYVQTVALVLGWAEHKQILFWSKVTAATLVQGADTNVIVMKVYRVTKTQEHAWLVATMGC